MGHFRGAKHAKNRLDPQIFAPHHEAERHICQPAKFQNRTDMITPEFDL